MAEGLWKNTKILLVVAVIVVTVLNLYYYNYTYRMYKMIQESSKNVQKQETEKRPHSLKREIGTSTNQSSDSIIYVDQTNSTNRKTKYILLWTAGLYHMDMMPKDCRVNNCISTRDRNLLPIEEYDALIFRIPTKRFVTESLPSKRSPHQRYIFFNRETPLMFSPAKGNVQFVLKNFFNWTMTYRMDSDIRRGYGEILRNENSYRLPSKDFLRGKTKSVAWFVSNCRNFSRRGDLAHKLSKYIDVDIYGRCGNLTCPKTSDCYAMLAKNYRFYLAFENSHCKDYITEKTYETLKHNVIPIVYGGADYNVLAPPHSVINVEDFQDVKSLANYLKMLEHDHEEYLSYFEWKKHYRIQKSSAKALCKLCEMLHDQNLPKKTYEDVEDWYFSKKKSGCKENEELPRIVID